MKPHAAIVGSGPAGLATAKALLRRGVQVTVLDVGEDLPADLKQRVDGLLRAPPDRWAWRDIAPLVANPTVRHATPSKLTFGSDYCYGGDRRFARLDLGGMDLTPTYARGGFSAIWGGAMLPAHDGDLSAWPLRQADLAPSYQRVLQYMPLSAAEDGLQEHFPLYADPSHALTRPRQAELLEQDMINAGERLKRDGLWFGRARLAVWSGSGNAEFGCNYCGLCHAGCPRGAIFNAGDEMEKLARHNSIDLKFGIAVEWVEESAKGVVVHMVDTETNEAVNATFDYVFLGAGVINSTRIVLASKHLYGHAVKVLDSQKFLLPMLRLPGAPVEWPRMNTLATTFMELRAPEISSHWFHAQVSPMHDLILQRLDMLDLKKGQLNLRGQLARPLLGRLMVLWCGLHSDDSSSAELTLEHGTGDRDGAVLRLRPLNNPVANKISNAVARRFAKLGLSFRTLFLTPLKVLGPPGSGKHSGGTMPMRSTPAGPLDTDILGRFKGWRRVHVVDSSVFPTVAATTMLLTIMANADRIATEAPLEQIGDT